MKKIAKKTITETLLKQIKVSCYLCGKGKITIRQGDIDLIHKLPLSHEVEQQWKSFLLEKSKEFFDSISN